MILHLHERRQESPDVESFIFKSNEVVSFTPGQFLRYTLVHENPDDRGIVRYFTIAAAPSENVIQITTRFAEHSSSFKKALHALKIGDSIDAANPAGSFTYTDRSVPAIFIAGGIGITPFRSMIKDAMSQHESLPVRLLYSGRDDSFVFKELFNEYAKVFKEFSVEYSVARITKEFISEKVSDFNKPLFYLSGPKPMVEGLTVLLQELGVQKEKIKLDFFPGYSE